MHKKWGILVMTCHAYYVGPQENLEQDSPPSTSAFWNYYATEGHASSIAGPRNVSSTCPVVPTLNYLQTLLEGPNVGGSWAIRNY